MIREPACYRRNCVHFRGVKNDGAEENERVVCAAFPDGIPDKIAFGEDLHLVPVVGDNGIVFEQGESR